MVEPYLKNTETFTCPSNPNSIFLQTNGVNDSLLADHYSGIYALRGGAQSVFTRYNTRGTHLAAFVSPATTFEVVEVTEGDTGSGVIDVASRNFANALFAGHLSTSNYLFADGRVKALRPSFNTLSPINMWTIDNLPFTGTDLTNAQACLSNATNTYR